MAVVDDCGRCDVAGGLHEGGKEDRRKQEARGQGRLRQGITTPGTGTTSPTCTRTGTTSPRTRSYHTHRWEVTATYASGLEQFWKAF